MTEQQTRAWVKGRGGQVVSSHRHGECYHQLWRTTDGRHWAGDDWYDNSRAVVYETTEQEWKRQHEVD